MPAVDLTELDALATLRIALRAVGAIAPGLRAARLDAGQTFRFPLGTGAGQANQVWYDLQNLLPSASLVVDLRSRPDGPLGPAGFSTVRALALLNISHCPFPAWGYIPTNANIALGRSTWPNLLVDVGDKIVLPPGGALVAVAPTAEGWPVGDSTYNCTIYNQSATEWCLYQIALIGQAP